jgi:hypothetical protein
MKNRPIQKISTLALGIIVFSYPIIQGSTAYGASLKNTVAVDNQLLKPGTPELQSSPTGGLPGCALSPAGGGTALPNVTGSANAASDVVASSAAGSVVPATAVANAPAFSDNAAPATAPDSASSTLIAQASLDDCCEIGGTSTCEVGGLAPAGGGLLGGGPSPLLALLGLPAALIPAFLGGGDGSNTPTPTPVPESSSTGAIAAGFGLIALWYGRRLRNVRKTYS